MSIIKILFGNIPRVFRYSPIVTFGGFGFEPSEPQLLYLLFYYPKIFEISHYGKWDPS